MTNRVHTGGEPILNGSHVKPRSEVRDEPHLTDTGNAIRMVRGHGDDLRHCWPWRRWLCWDGRRWRIDDSGEPQRRAKETVRGLYRWAVGELAALADRMDDDEEAAKKAQAAKKVIGHCLASESASRLNAMLDLARSERGIPMLPAELDADPWQLNCANGTVDLRTGETRDHCRGDYITRLCPTAYRPEATCPTFLRFLDELFPATGDAAETAGNTDTIEWLQRLLGYCLTGDVREQVLPIFWGCGANGKSTLLTALQDVLGGDFTMKAPPELLMVRKGETHPTERADLFGRRLVLAVETEAGGRLAEALVKELTGGDRIRARRMREDFWEFSPTHKVFLVTNHKPKVRGTDPAIWRRVRLVPFAVTFPPERQDKDLPAKLAAEAEGILAWLVAGCLKWQRQGLGMSDEVARATAQYKSESDTVAAFVAERCVTSRDPAFRVRASDLYTAYRQWCEALGEREISSTEFGEQVSNLDGVEKKKISVTWYLGIVLRPGDTDE